MKAPEDPGFLHPWLSLVLGIVVVTTLVLGLD